MLRVGGFSCVDIAETVADTAEAHRHEALSWLRRWVRLQRLHRKNAAVVFDVDHTLVEPSAGDPRLMVRIPSVCDFYQYCIGSGMACFIVTAREDFEHGRQVLRELLQDIGATGATAMYLRPGSVRPTVANLAEFKGQCRDDIEKRYGVSIVANLGDNWHDLLKPPFDCGQDALWELDDSHSFVGVFPSQEAGVKLPGSTRSRAPRVV